jgi:hypothetical protein
MLLVLLFFSVGLGGCLSNDAAGCDAYSKMVAGTFSCLDAQDQACVDLLAVQLRQIAPVDYNETRLDDFSRHLATTCFVGLRVLVLPVFSFIVFRTRVAVENLFCVNGFRFTASKRDSPPCVEVFKDLVRATRMPSSVLQTNSTLQVVKSTIKQLDARCGDEWAFHNCDIESCIINQTCSDELTAAKYVASGLELQTIFAVKRERKHLLNIQDACTDSRPCLDFVKNRLEVCMDFLLFLCL